MSEIVKVTKSKNKPEISKRGMLEYFDIIMAFINSTAIILVFILINNSILLLSIIGFIFAAILLVETIISYLKRNPFYIYFCYGLALNGVLGDLIFSFINPIFILLFIPIGFYGYTIYEYIMYPMNKRMPYYQQNYIDNVPPPYIASTKNTKQEFLVEKMRKDIDNKFKFTSIALISIGCSLGLLIILIISTII